MCKYNVQKMIKARAKNSNVAITNYSKIRVISHRTRPGNAYESEHDYLFEYNGKIYMQTDKVTGEYSANHIYHTCEMS